MSELESRRQSVREWLEIAEEDSQVVAMALSADPPFIRTAVFHAQQAGEKYLKGFLQWHEIAFPKTHDLKLLLQLSLQVDASLDSLRQACFRLTELGVEPRYAMPPPPLTQQVAREAQADAVAIREAILARLPEGLQTRG